MASCFTLDDLENAKTRIDVIDRSSTKDKNLFTYQHPFGLYLKYRHQVNDHNNQRHAPILRNSIVIFVTLSAIVPELILK